MFKKAVILSIILVVLISSADAYVPDIGSSGPVGTCQAWRGNVLVSVSCSYLNANTVCTDSYGNIIYKYSQSGSYKLPTLCDGGNSPPVSDKTHGSLPYTTLKEPYDYVQNCLETQYASSNDANLAIKTCENDYNQKTSNYYVFSVASCPDDCLGQGYTDCNSYCNAIYKKYDIMTNWENIHQAIDDWANYYVSIGKIVRQADPTCSDRIQNQGETGIDCGGPCRACAPRASCFDNIRNQGETGVDCGGPCKLCTPAPTCTDGIKNRGETQVDCGGPCKACPTCYDGIQNQGEKGIDCGDPCMDCPSCFDTIKNQGETEIDCGGPCEPCPEPTCDDGIQNQGEEYVDCGGPCTFVCPTCDDNIKNQGEKTVDCGGPCTQCVMTFEDLPKEDQILVLRLWVKAIDCVLYYKDKDCAALAHATAQRIITEAAKEKGADPSKYDVFEKLKQLQEEQKSMSDEEKNKRIGAARVAYQDMIIDQYALETGHAGEEIKKVIENKKEEVKAEYGRVLFFDHENTQANVALADIYWDEGNKVDSVAFYYKGLKNADAATTAKIEKRLAEVYEEQAAKLIGFKEPPRPTMSQIMAQIHTDIDDPSVTEILIRDRIRLAKAMAKSVEISPNRLGLLKLARDTVLGFNQEQVDYLGDPSED